jgi:hypothetical protein
MKTENKEMFGPSIDETRSQVLLWSCFFEVLGRIDHPKPNEVNLTIVGLKSGMSEDKVVIKYNQFITLPNTLWLVCDNPIKNFY